MFFVSLSQSTVNPPTQPYTLYSLHLQPLILVHFHHTVPLHIQFVSTFSYPNSQYLPVSHIFMYTHGRIHICWKVIKLYYGSTGEFYWYSKVIFVYRIVDFFFILLIPSLVFIKESFFSFPTLVNSVCVCVCGGGMGVCVCVGGGVFVRARTRKKSAFIMQYDVSDSINFEELLRKFIWFLDTAVGRECCIAEYKQAVRHRVVQSGFSELDQLVKIFIVFYQILWLITVILLLYIDQITFISLSHKHHF
jgi:hypothetical protein